MLSPEDAVALVSRSVLFDAEHYAAQVEVVFSSREEAARHWVTDRPDGAAPHALFEPLWLYPGGRWRTRAPDPLSFYLSRPEGRGRSPHPRYPQGDLGPLEEWLAEHDPRELLPEPQPRDPVAEVVVVVPVEDLPTAVRWIRHLAKHSPEVTAAIDADPAGQPAAQRILATLAADRPSVHVGPVPEAPVVVRIDPGISPPTWPFVADLVAALAPGVGAVQPLLLREDFTVAAPLFVGHPTQDAERAAHLPIPEPVPGVLARRVGVDGPTRLAPEARLFGPDHLDAGAAWLPWWETAGLGGPGERLRVSESAPRLRWSIDIPAGAAPIGRRWGDWHFARSLADALERQGQLVSIDHPETRARATRRLDDVTLTLRGLDAPEPPAHTVNLLWVIYDPSRVTREEAARHDAVFAAGRTWSEQRSAEWGIPITPLLQCTDTTRFRPGLAEPGEEVLFVGNARGGLRPVVAAALEADLDLAVIGYGWDPWLPQGRARLEADRIENRDLPARYAAAGVVLCDHHADMRAEGFVANRVFDVLAVGGRLLTDDVPGLDAVLDGVPLPTWNDASDLARLARPPFEAFPDAETRQRLAEHVVAHHSFDARARQLLDAARRYTRRS